MNVRERLEEMLKPNADGLLPCPWCGSPDPDNHQHEFSIICRHCSARGAFIADEKDRVSAWNSRPFIRALLAAIDALPCDQDMHARHREAECDRCVLETKIDAILEGREG